MNLRKAILLISIFSCSLLHSQNQVPTWDVCDGFLIDEQNETCTKVNSDDWQNAELTSFNHLLADQNGNILIKMDSTFKDVAIGLSAVNDGRHYSTIDYAFYFHENGDVWIIENGSLIRNMGAIPHDEKLYIKRNGGSTIKYTIRNQVQYISLNSSSAELFVDISAKNKGQIIKGVKANFLNTCSNIWELEFGVVYNIADRSIQKNSSSNSWTSSYVISENYIASSEDGAIQFRISDNSMNKGFGFLEEGLSSYSPSDFLHAFYFSGNVAHIFENGRVASRLDASSSEEKYAITKTGNTIKYYKNGTLVYTSNTITTDNMVMGASLYNGNGNVGFKNIESTFSNIRLASPIVDDSNFENGVLAYNENIFCSIVSMAEKYSWRFESNQGNQVIYKETDGHFINPFTVDEFIEGVNYLVSVQARNDNEFSSRGIEKPVKLEVKAPSCFTLTRKTNAGHFLVFGDFLWIKYDEEYSPQLDQPNIKIFDIDHNEMSFQIESSNYDFGDNRFLLNIESLDQDGFYNLELINGKNESFFLKFLKS